MTSVGTRTSNFQFTGQQVDGRGLVYLRARYLEPAVGRFLSRDVWEGDPNQPMSYNGWLYAAGNPVNRDDPTGHCYGPLSFLRGVPIERDVCTALDQAMFVYAWPGSSRYERLLAEGYIGTWALAHSMLIVGAGGLAVGGAQEAVLWLYAMSHGGPAADVIQQSCENLQATASSPMARQALQQTSSWAAPWWERGRLIHGLLGENLRANFPVIDRFANGLATSIKSLDLTSPTYQNISNLTSRVQGYLVELARFQGAYWIQSGSITARELVLAVRPGVATDAQWMALEAMRDVATQLGIVLTILEVP